MFKECEWDTKSFVVFYCKIMLYSKNYTYYSILSKDDFIFYFDFEIKVVSVLYINHEAFSKFETEMHDHVTHYHVTTSCRLANLLSFNLMAGKRKFHPVVLSSASKKAKKDRDKFRATHGCLRRTESIINDVAS